MSLPMQREALKRTSSRDPKSLRQAHPNMTPRFQRQHLVWGNFSFLLLFKHKIRIKREVRRALVAPRTLWLPQHRGCQMTVQPPTLCRQTSNPKYFMPGFKGQKIFSLQISKFQKGEKKKKKGQKTDETGWENH